MTRPLIGITSRLYDHKPGDFAVANGVRQPYSESVIAAGGTPLIIPLVAPGRWLDELYERLDGLLVPGGEDVDPARYGEAAHEKLGAVSQLRDEIEIRLIEKSFTDKKPFLGICRGMQVANVALGGSLHQHLPDREANGIVHPLEDAPWNATSHEIMVIPGSRLSKILGVRRLAVNSFHHQGVKTLAAPLRPCAVSADELVEGFETPGSAQFFVAVQGHPETLCLERSGLGEIGRIWLRLFEAFIDEAAKDPA